MLRLFHVSKPIIGMLHAPALPGAPGYGGRLETVRTAVLRDAEALVAGGVHGLMLENFGDAPFYPGRVPAHVVAIMTSLAVELRKTFDIPLGINVLRNDGRSALAVAVASGAQFIRVNVLCGARVTDQGILQGIAHHLLRDRVLLEAGAIKILADVDVKHSAPLGPRPLEDEARETLHRGGADGLIVSGAATGQPTDVASVSRVKQVVGQAPVLVGSGVTPESIARFLPYADGFIVGTSIKRGGATTNPVDPARVKALVEAV
jgi:membrane complex biogenesis BtpA family protein